MKTRLIISDRSWEYRLQAVPQLPGAYYVKLAALDGGRLDQAPITGPFATLDAIVEQAARIYLQLVAMLHQPRPFPAAPARDNSQITKTTTPATETETKPKHSLLSEYEYTGHTGLRPVE